MKNYSAKSLYILPILLGAFLSARTSLDPNFVSMDYSAYISLFRDISKSSHGDLIDNLYANLPTPYILVSGVTTIEYGFALIVKQISQLGFEDYQIFSIIAGFSAFLHQLTLQRIGQTVILSVLTFIYSSTLLETNAIRAGLSISILLYLLYKGLVQDKKWAMILTPACIFLHVQSGIWMISVFASYTCIKLFWDNIVYRAASLISLVLLASPAGLLFDYIFPNKFESYSGIVLNSAGWTPLNSLAMAICVSSFFIIISWNPKAEHLKIWKYWICAFTSFFQSSVFLVYNTDFGAIGQRIWQFSFLMFIAASAMIVAILKENLPHGFRYIRYATSILLLLLCVNVVFRYPLSNIFYPFAPPVRFDVY